MMDGTVIRSTGSWYDVRLEDDLIVPVRMTGKFRLQGLRLTNPVAVGDRVQINLEAGTIEKIYPRDNYVVRQSPRKKHYLHLLASNIDQALLITTIRSPEIKPGFIDRFLLMTESYEIPVIIAINKIDLLDEEDLEYARAVLWIYDRIGYDTVLVSAASGEGLDTLGEKLYNRRTLVSGHSGVGKSSLINRLVPELDQTTKDLSDYTGKGQHTTTFAELFGLPEGGEIIDTPGIKTLGFNYLTPEDVRHNFREIFSIGKECKYGDCTHRSEPKCAVRDAVEGGEITASRYEHYLYLLDEITAQKYWERLDG